MDSPPLKAVPPDCPRQNNRSPWTKYRSHTWSPPAADCDLFAVAFATVLVYGEQPGHCLFDQNKVMEAISAEVSAGGGDDTTLIEEESA